MTDANTKTNASDLPLIVIGAGGHAGVLINTLALLGRHVICATDSDPESFGRRLEEIEIRGNDELIFDHQPHTVELVNGVGSAAVPHKRQAVFERFKKASYRFASVIHPSAVVATSARLGEGVQLMAGSVIQHNVQLDDNTLVNTRASVGHDCVVGRHAHISAGVTVCGSVRIGQTTHIGAGATVIQGIRIGENALVGAGALVTRDVSPHSTVVGVPARPRDNRPASSGNVTEQQAAQTSTIMLSASGRRVALMQLIKKSANELGLASQILATDVHRLNATYHLAEAAARVPEYSQPHCLEHLLELCRQRQIQLIVPTIDPDLNFYVRHLQAFKDQGACIMVSSSETVELCLDKHLTHQWFQSQDIPTVQQCLHDDWPPAHGQWRFPLFIKPRRGSSSIGSRQIANEQELAMATAEGNPCIIQELAYGREYTVDAYVDRTGRCRCTVPRLRIETRGGEVSKGMTVRHERIQHMARTIAESLPGAWGVLNIQMFYDENTDDLRVIEINPRFGGGYPLSHAAGAPMSRWMLEETFNYPLTAAENQWQDGLVMLRYDQAVYVDRHQAGI